MTATIRFIRYALCRRLIRNPRGSWNRSRAARSTLVRHIGCVAFKASASIVHLSLLRSLFTFEACIAFESRSLREPRSLRSAILAPSGVTENNMRGVFCSVVTMTVMKAPIVNRFVKSRYHLAVLSLVLLLVPAGAFNYVADGNGTWWGIQDAAPPRVDTGSIRATQIGPGVSPAYSTSINGFGGIRVFVDTTPEPRFNGEIMRGFGLTFDGVNRFTTTKSVKLGGVKISRSVYINQNENWGRWLDSFTNTTQSPITIQVAFGGQSGIGNTGGNSSSIVQTSSGDTMVTPADSWVEVATPLADATLVGGPQVTVLGTPTNPARPFIGAMTFAGNWLVDPFGKALAYTGHEANFQAYVNTITLSPGHTRSLLHFVVIGQRVDSSSSPVVRAAVETTATRLSVAPAISDLSAAEICSIDNFDFSALTAHGFNV